MVTVHTLDRSDELLRHSWRCPRFQTSGNVADALTRRSRHRHRSETLRGGATQRCPLEGRAELFDGLFGEHPMQGGHELVADARTDQVRVDTGTGLTLRLNDLPVQRRERLGERAHDTPLGRFRRGGDAHVRQSRRFVLLGGGRLAERQHDRDDERSLSRVSHPRGGNQLVAGPAVVADQCPLSESSRCRGPQHRPARLHECDARGVGNCVADDEVLGRTQIGDVQRFAAEPRRHIGGGGTFEHPDALRDHLPVDAALDQLVRYRQQVL
ncbi:Uncharacterised protein [Mycobacteroides abscessus subsp. abscessus]|nr:Uncharacterised protein [Mycobacteroides abscessus subsp. abscessus]